MVAAESSKRFRSSSGYSYVWMGKSCFPRASKRILDLFAWTLPWRVIGRWTIPSSLQKKKLRLQSQTLIKRISASKALSKFKIYKVNILAAYCSLANVFISWIMGYISVLQCTSYSYRIPESSDYLMNHYRTDNEYFI